MAGDALGKSGDGTTAGEGGLAIRRDAVDQGVRSNVNFRETPGVRWTVVDDPAPPARVIVTAELDAEVLLAPPVTGLDLTAAPGVLATLLAAIDPQLEHVTRIVLISELIVGLSVQPTVRSQTDATLPGNLAATQALAFTVAGQVAELVLATPRLAIDAGPSTADEAILELIAAATATTYDVTAQIWGVVLTP